jgi:MFS family permease
MSITPDGERAPSWVRHRVVALATLMAVLLYLDRICLSITMPFITEDLGLKEWQSDWLLGAFFWTYGLAQVPSGWLSDRFGPRRVLTLYIILWSLFTGLMGVAGSFLALLAYRFACGLAQAGAYPTSAGMLSKWVPFRDRGLASGIVSTGGRLGGFIAPVLTAYLIVLFVPPRTSSLLTAEDLLDPVGLCRALVSPPAGPAARLGPALRGLLPGDAAAVVDRGASSEAALSGEETAMLVRGLNEVLAGGDLAAAVPLSELPLAAEGRRLAGRRAEDLSPQERQRRNRLVLEAAYPPQVRKIYGRGWRPVMVVYAVAGLLVAGWFWSVVRDRPAEHPSCNAAEQALIEQGRPPSTVVDHSARAMPWAAMLRSRGLWLSSLAQFTTNFGWVFLITLLPRYLEQAHHVPILERGWMASVPILVGMAGMLAGGWVVDALTRRLGLRWGRCLPMALTRFVALSAFVACLGLQSPWAVTLALSVVAVATDLGTPATWAFMQDVGGAHVGSVLGWGNMWGNFGAALGPVILGAIVGTEGRWDLCFLACAAAFLAAGVASLGIDARIPILPPQDAEARKRSEAGVSP